MLLVSRKTSVVPLNIDDASHPYRRSLHPSTEIEGRIKELINQGITALVVLVNCGPRPNRGPFSTFYIGTRNTLCCEPRGMYELHSSPVAWTKT